MAKTINLSGQIKLITSGTKPTTENLKKGQLAFGEVEGVKRLYGSTGTEIVELTFDDSTLKGLIEAAGNYTVNGKKISTNPELTKSDVGLGNVTDDAQIPLSQKGKASGVATLDSSGKVPSSQLPSYVDDVVEIAGVFSSAPVSGGYETGDLIYQTSGDKGFYKCTVNTGVPSWEKDASVQPESGKIYVAVKDGNKQYRWSGTEMVVITSGNIVIGEAGGTAFDGARGKALEDWKTKLSGKQLFAYSGNRTEAVKITQDSTSAKILFDIMSGGGDVTEEAAYASITAATTSAAGVMSAADKQSLEDLKGITVTLTVEEI